MALYLVQVPANQIARHLVNGINSAIVSAVGEADAKAIAEAQFGGDTGGMWMNANATLLEEVTTAPANTRFYLAVVDPDGEILFEETVTQNDQITLSSVSSLTIVNGGTGYSDNDILTVAGAADVPATIQVTQVNGSGVIEEAWMLNSGLYTSAPDTTANAVTGGDGAGATFDLVTEVHTFPVLLARMAKLLNDSTDIAIAGAYYAPAGSNLIVAETTDTLGDHTVVAHFYLPDSDGNAASNAEVDGVINAITHEGLDSDALSINFSDFTSFVYPKVFAFLKS
jgi:hypothetical protein